MTDRGLSREPDRAESIPGGSLPVVRQWQSRLSVLAVFAGLCLLATSAHAQIGPQPATVIENARILTMDGDAIENGAIVIRGGRIAEVGENVQVPRRATRIDGSGMVVTPGLIDVHSALGMAPGGGGSGLVTGHAWDAFDRYNFRLLEEALSQGVTTVHIGPLGASGFGGLGTVVRLTRSGQAGPIGSVYRARTALNIDMSSGGAIERIQNFNRIRNEFRAAATHRETLERYEEELAEYLKKIEELQDDETPESGAPAQRTPRTEPQSGDAGQQRREQQPRPQRRGPGGSDMEGDHATSDSDISGVQSANGSALDDPPPPRPQPPRRRPRGGPQDADPPQTPRPQQQRPQRQGSNDDELKRPEQPSRNPAYDVLIDALNHEIPVRVVANRSEDILNAIDLAKEFRLRLIIEGASEAHLVAREIAEAGATVVIQSPQSSMLARTRAFGPPGGGRDESQVGALERTGIDWAMGSGGSNAATARFLLYHAQMLAQEATAPVDPLQLMTAQAADVLGLGDEIGRLRPGMNADLVLWSGDPLDADSRVQQVFIGGQEVFRADEQDGQGGQR